MRVYRIAAEAFGKTAAQTFSGQGGLYGMGRWHGKGRLIVYCSQRLSLSALEALVHIQRNDRIEPFVYWEMEVPEGRIEKAANLPADWKTNLPATQKYGDVWLDGKKRPALLVPSVLIETESNVLLNPSHPDFDLGWIVKGPVPFVFDQRLTAP